MRIAIGLSVLLSLGTAACGADEAVGKRPYEMDWANRFQDDHPPLVDFENMDGWTVRTGNSAASLVRTREQQLWDKYVAKFTYRATGAGPTYLIAPRQPLPVGQAFEAVSLWVYGNNWSYAPNASTPMVSITAKFLDAQGRAVNVPLTTVTWEEWFLCSRRLTPEQIAMVKDGASFAGLEIANGRNKEDRVLFFDNLAVFTEQFPPLTFEPRPERGIAMFPGQGSGTNTGPGKLPFPTRPETILPDNLVQDFQTTVRQEGTNFVLTYVGSDGTLTYTLAPRTGTWSDLTARWGQGPEIRPLVDGGVRLAVDGQAVAAEKLEPLGTTLDGQNVISKWQASAGGVSAQVTYTFRLWNKSLVIDTAAPGGDVAEVRYGHAEGLDNPRCVTNPFYHYGHQASDRPAVAVSGPADQPLFLTGNTDWYLSNASVPFSANAVQEGRTSYQGGVRYVPKTDGKRNDCFERFFVTLAPRYEEVLPTLPNPKSPYMPVAGTHVWRAHGASVRGSDAAYWTNIWRHGMRECVITDHETGWRDGGESFTFRTRPAPGKGGDQGQFDYARLMQDQLGFVYGPYNNFTDFAPVNEFWSFDLISRTPDNQLQGAWMRCYAPKPARAVEYCAKLAPIIQNKFHFSTAYCDVHTAVAPWERVDYDRRVPGAGTFAATFYSYGEIMLHQKNAWKGPVYSEGNHHFYYSGLTDGNYAQDRGYDIPNNPWLVDLDLRKMHDLNCNFGMGAESMFYGESTPTAGPADKDAYTDRFLAATVAFGHPGFLCSGGLDKTLRGYYLIQQLAASYTQSPVKSIGYLDEAGRLLETSAAIASGAYQRNQIVTEYANGTTTMVNGHKTERMTFGGHELPPNGYCGWTRDRSVFVASTDSGPGTPRHDLCVSPAYIYIDGRGQFTRLDQAASDGIGICRIVGPGQWEIIPYQGADCGFRLPPAKAVALNKDGQELGPAELRVARGLTYAMPAKDAFSYLLTATSGEAQAPAQQPEPRDRGIAGETVPVKLSEEHAVQIPADAKPGQRIWQQLEGQWFDFTVVPLAEVEPALAGQTSGTDCQSVLRTVEPALSGQTLSLRLRSNLAQRETYRVEVLGRSQAAELAPDQPAEVAFDLGPPAEEGAELLAITLTAGKLTQKTERGLRTVRAPQIVVPLPAHYDAGLCLRGGQETGDFGATLGYVVPRSATCGEVTKEALFMHPPYQGQTGYSFAVYDAVTLPQDRPAAIRAVVGKGDGSDPGDGILYRLAVKDPSGAKTVVAEQTVLRHEWRPIEADLSRWAGQTVRVQLISDVGTQDNSSGDWACWAEMRIESLQPVLQRTLEPSGEAYRREPPPLPLAGVTVNQLRKARRGWLHYDGNGFSGGGAYGCFAVLNGVNMGLMTPAGGDETRGIWATDVTMPLTPEALVTLGRHNMFAVSDPNKDWFKIRRFWIELELADGRKISSDIAAATFTQPPGWAYAEGVLVPHGQDITVDLWFAVQPAPTLP